MRRRYLFRLDNILDDMLLFAQALPTLTFDSQMTRYSPVRRK